MLDRVCAALTLMGELGISCMRGLSLRRIHRPLATVIVSEEVNSGPEFRREREACFHQSVLFELVWCQNSPTREQHRRAVCRPDFQEDLSGEACEWRNWGLSKERLIWVGSCYSSKLRRWPRSKADSQLAPQRPRELSGGAPSL